ncbi:MAG: hypothetical protein ACI8UO_004748 [Verrucomicrobiales bacterium]|jgi:hypothetical protein
MVLILSEASNRSKHVHRELDRALENQTEIIPVRIDRHVLTGAMRYFMSTCQWIDAAEGGLNDALRILKDRLTRLRKEAARNRA